MTAAVVTMGGDPPYKIVHLNGREQAYIDSVLETGQEAMHDDAIARWLVRDSLHRRFWSLMNDQYILPTESNLNVALEGAESIILARIYPDEEKVSMELLEGKFWRQSMQLTTGMVQVSFLAGVWQQIQMMPCFWLTRLVAATTVGDTMDARKAAFAKVIPCAHLSPV